MSLQRTELIAVSGAHGSEWMVSFCDSERVEVHAEGLKVNSCEQRALGRAGSWVCGNSRFITVGVALAIGLVSAGTT